MAAENKRRRLRFSLKSMLLVVTVIAVSLGAYMRHLNVRRDAIKAIDELGGTYGVRIVGPKWLQALLGDEKYFYDATRVSFGPYNQGYNPSHPFKDADLARMIDHINVFDSFNTLDLNGSSITDEGLRDLKRLRNIEILWLSGTSVTDNCLPYLSDLKSLREVDLTVTQVTDVGAAKLQQSLPSCRIKH
jgi:hypothetical protein